MEEKNVVEKVTLENFIMQTVSQENIVKLKYAFQDSSNVYLATEFCEGGDLAVHLEDEDEDFSEQRIKFYAASIISALEHVHDSGYIFKDLKPENLLLDRQGYLKLADFGLARRSDDSSDTSLAGTAEYFAPETIL